MKFGMMGSDFLRFESRRICLFSKRNALLEQ